MRLVCAASLLIVTCDAVAPVYEATIDELNGSGVTGKVVVFSAGEGSPVVAYAGFGEGLSPNLVADDCTATNACGAHIHSGIACGSTEEQGGHYYVGLPDDPWLVERYTSDSVGSAEFSGVLSIGTDDIEGRAFLLHNEAGGRVGCGLLKRVPESKILVGYTNDGVGLAEINDSKATGNVVVYQPNNDYVCHYGTGSNLEPDLVSFLNGGPHCSNANGCGAHIHSGSSCVDSASQGGHFYDSVSLAEDPWKYAGYLFTDSSGNGSYTSCLKTGETIFNDKAFVLHGEDGGRVACGILSSCQTFRKCSSFIGSGHLMSRKRIILNAISKLFGSGDESCEERCIPSYASAFSEALGFTCGGCSS